MGSNLKVSCSARWHISWLRCCSVFSLERSKERISDSEGVIDIRDVTIVIGLSHQFTCLSRSSVPWNIRPPERFWVNSQRALSLDTEVIEEKAASSHSITFFLILFCHSFLQKWSGSDAQSDRLMPDWQSGVRIQINTSCSVITY